MFIFELGFLYSHLFQEYWIGFDADAWTWLRCDLRRSRELDFRLAKIVLIKPICREDIRRVLHVLERGERDRMALTDRGFQHATNPARYARVFADRVDFERVRDATDMAAFDVDPATCADRNRLASLFRRYNALVKTYRRLDLPLQVSVVDEVVVHQRLLDELQVVLVKLV